MISLSRLCMVVGALLWAAATAGAAQPAAANPQDITLEYDIYFGGFHGFRLRVNLALDSDRYDVKTEVRTGGFVARLVSWSLNAYSKGRIRGLAVTPSAAGHSSIWRGKPRAMEMSFGSDGATVTRIEPPPGEDGRDRIPPELLKNTMDLASAVLSISRSMKVKGGCNHRLPVFDGRRRYDLVLNQLERAEMVRNRYSPFHGAVLICRAEIDRIKGFKPRDWSDDDAGRNRSVVVSIGTVFDDVSPMPVRIDFESRFGAVIAHLVRAETTSGGTTRALGH